MNIVKKIPVSNNYNYVLFADGVKTHFYFLVQDYHYRLSEVKQTGYVKFIRFESKDIFVNLYYGPPAYEVEIAFGRIGIDDVRGIDGVPVTYSFSMNDLVLLHTCADWKESFPGEDRITGQIMFFSQLMRKCGTACLCGEQVVFEEMSARRNAALLEYQREERMKQMRRELDTAWGQKNYNQVINLLNSSEVMLTKVERKKLEYAEKHTQK